MTDNSSTSKRNIFSLVIFLAGLIMVVIALRFPTVEQFFQTIGQSGVIGAFVAGILYAFSFTSSLATVIFLKIPNSINPLAMALIAGLGSALYDLTVFTIVKGQTSQGFLQNLRAHLAPHHKIPDWLSMLIGLLILASPLPDELAAGFLGFMKLDTKKFIILSFFANTLGILIIILASK